MTLDALRPRIAIEERVRGIYRVQGISFGLIAVLFLAVNICFAPRVPSYWFDFLFWLPLPAFVVSLMATELLAAYYCWGRETLKPLAAWALGHAVLMLSMIAPMAGFVFRDLPVLAVPGLTAALVAGWAAINCHLSKPPKNSLT